MKTCWQKLLLDGLEALDRQESSHGVYGMRQVYSAKGRLPSLAHLLSSSGQTNVLRPSELQSLLGRSANPQFLNRYGVAHFSRNWEDRYDRGFQTAIHLEWQ